MYRRYNVPGSRNVLFTGANANFNPFTPLRVDFKKADRAPLLFIAGGNDHVIPASVNRHNAAKYRHSQSVTRYKEFAGRTHYTLGQDGWEEVADYALDWAADHVAEVVRPEPYASGHTVGVRSVRMASVRQHAERANTGIGTLVSRRNFLKLTAGAALAGVLAGCSSSDNGAAGIPSASGPSASDPRTQSFLSLSALITGLTPR